MKIKINQEDFSKALLIASRSISTKSNLPVLSNVLLSTSKKGLEVVSTNLEAAIKVSVACGVGVEGKITLPGKILMEFVSQLPLGEIEMEKLGEEVVVKTKGYSARLATIAPEEFPAIPRIEKGIAIKVGAGEFIDVASMVAFCAAQDEGRPVLNGVLCEVNKNGLSMVATDGYRLSFAHVDLGEETSGIKFLVPAKALLEFSRILADLGGEISGEVLVTVAENLSQVSFKVGGVELTSRLIEGEFPNWQKIIPASFLTKIKLDKEEFVKRIKIASIFARDAGNIVRLNVTPKTLTIIASTSQVASNETQMDVDGEGKGGEIAFNYRYLLEVLVVLGESEVFFEMSESLTPGRLTTEDNKYKFFHIIMPVRLQG